MSFNSYEFIFAFLPIALAGVWVCTHFGGRRGAIVWLILASVAFYVYSGWKSLLFIAPSILLDYGIARALLRSEPERERSRRVLFVAGVTANVLFLAFFKYYYFLVEMAGTAFSSHFERLIVPLGISFIVFQKIAFLADVRSGQVKEVRFLDYLLFTLFFPRIVAGPIVRYQELIPQLASLTPSSLRANAPVAICLFAIGLFKKVIIADNLVQYVSPTFGMALSDRPLGFLVAWLGVLAYTFQLYFDFSGYSDMALGVARFFGVRLPMNFNSPFKATNIVDFWNRWHISLTRFLIAYIYTPIVLHLTRARVLAGKPVLRGKRSSLSAIAALVAFPTITTMVISGIWHGAGWQFVAWGLLHGAYLTINQTWRLLRPRFWSNSASYEPIMKPVGLVLTFTCVVIALVFFRAASVDAALAILASMVGLHGFFPYPAQMLDRLGIDPWVILRWMGTMWLYVWVLLLFPVVFLLPNSLELLRRLQPALDFPQESPPQNAAIGHRSIGAIILRAAHEPVALRRLTAAVAALLCVIGIMGLNQGTAFIYGQF